jgi:hypothetical protein
VLELAHDLLTAPAPTGGPGAGRRPSRPLRAVLLLVALAVTGVVTAGCAPTTTGSTSSGSGSGGAGLVTAGAGGGGVVSEDPDHGSAQPFPAPGTCHDRAAPNGTLPDPVCTPGASDPHVTQDTIGTTICRRGGYTSTVRPPASVTGTEKKAALRAYNDTAPSSSYELDHLVSLELGGSPNSPRNLWPEPGAAPNPKDKLETALHDLVCAHRMTLVDAQTAIATDWVSAYRQVLGAEPPAPR